MVASVQTATSPQPRPRWVPDPHLPVASADGFSGVSDERLRELIRAYMHHAPLALVLRELNRLLAIESLPQTTSGRILDVGCGDGFWWTLRPKGSAQIFGVDIDEREVALASRRIDARCADVSKALPYPESFFDEIIGNCSLEHIPDLATTLRQLRRVAKPAARLVLFVPSHHWALHGRTQQMLLRHVPRLGMALAGALDGFFQHWHVYGPEMWADLLARCGWRTRSTHGLGNEKSEFLFRLFLPQALPGFLCKQTLGHYPNAALRFLPERLLKKPEDCLAWALEHPLVDAHAPSTYEYMIVAQAETESK